MKEEPESGTFLHCISQIENRNTSPHERNNEPHPRTTPSGARTPGASLTCLAKMMK
jgi:hypothetical protein